MHLGTAKGLTFAALIIIFIDTMLVGFFAVIFAFAGVSSMANGDTSNENVMCTSIVVIVVLAWLAGESFCIYVHITKMLRPIMNDDFSAKNNKKFILAAMIVSFFVGNGLLVIIFDVLVFSAWDEFSRPPASQYPGFPYGNPYYPGYQYPPGYPMPPGYSQYPRQGPIMGTPPPNKRY